MGPDLGRHRNPALRRGTLWGAEGDRWKSKLSIAVRIGDRQAPPGRHQGKESLCMVSGLNWLSEEWPRKPGRKHPTLWEGLYPLGTLILGV